MNKFEGKLIVSDMDATLIGSDGVISEKNRRAIEYFISEGGRFTVASGRMVPAVRAYFSQMKINAPAVLHNGAKLYDYKAEKAIFEKFIEEERKACVKRVYENAPHLGIEIYSNERVYVYRANFETARFKTKPYDVCYELPDDVWNEPWIKVLIIGHRSELDEFEPVYRREYDDGYCVRSGDKYLDIVANGVSKGLGVKKLAELLGTELKDVVAVGDNMNDTDMLQIAGLGCAVSNAEPEVKAVADRIVGSCDESAISEIIESL